ncbi:MAG: type II toxin-antitoxin system Phd/YefM family antitoxin [Deltaproteobacteria bacterium]|nr:type II toxin-antitoxin system Phd/YefM family antitoxin [Deltaproteobacteria bacterium]MBW2394990.1 type II toxin-antitoxin system Phd/YefM family antitoxin [Deltaproteobacteria bacterium]
MPNTIRVSEARGDFSEIVDRAAHRHERVRLSRHGKEVAAMVPIEDLELLELLEDRLDLDAMREALAESDKRIPYDTIRQELGLK